MKKMKKTKNCKKQKYKESLYSNLIMACIMSEIVDDPIEDQPLSVIKKNPMTINENTDNRVFIMKWNPENSSYKIADFENSMEDFKHYDFYFEWSICNYQNVQVGDRFCLLKVGNGNTGIVMTGLIVCMPYKNEKSRSKDGEILYVRMKPDCMIHPDKAHIFSLQQLVSSFPEADWNINKSGLLLNDKEACKFDELWCDYLNH